MHPTRSTNRISWCVAFLVVATLVSSPCCGQAGGSISLQDAKGLSDAIAAMQSRLGDGVLVTVESEVGGLGYARIVGGKLTLDGEYPDCAAVGSVDEQFFCSGVLVSPDLVLTARHCIPGVGKVFLKGSSLLKSSTGVFLDVAEEIPHPSEDVALLKLASPSQVVPRRIARVCEVPMQVSEATAVGFGTTNLGGTVGYGTKRQVQLPVSDLDCARPTEAGCRAGVEMVAGLRALDKDSCSGDSGGPLYVEIAGQQVLLGLTSRGVKSATRECGDGGIYVRADRLISWIESESGETLAAGTCN